MIGRLFKIAVLVLGIADPSTAMADGCVADVDTKISFVENGKQYQANRIADYMALITRRDLHNSKGLRLANFAAVMQQDRANLYKTGTPDIVGEYMDTREDYFTTRKRRNQLSTMRYYSDCTLTRLGVTALQNDILNAGGLGVLWVVVFQHPDGKPAIYLSQVD